MLRRNIGVGPGVTAGGHVVKLKSMGAGALGLVTAALGLAQVAPAATSAAVTGAVSPQIVMAKHMAFARVGNESVPSYGQCQSAHVYCYTPAEIRKAYSVNTLLDAHHDGKGQTIVIIDAYGSPTITKDLKSFDSTFKLPAASLKIYKFGTIRYNQHSKTVTGWEGETSLDVEWAHTIAPDAKIDLLVTADAGNFYPLASYAYNHHLGKILSQSWGQAANNLTSLAAGRRYITTFDALYRKMVNHGWTVFASAGDSGTYNDGYSSPTVEYPASAPTVTSVGGTSLLATSSGTWEKEVVWNDGSSGYGAGGGGVSKYFTEPSYQRDYVKGYEAKVLHGKRGVPDVSWDGDPNTGVWVRCTASSACQGITGFPGWSLVGGTSAGAPQWAGYLADVDQAVGHGMGAINTTLYRLGSRGEGYHDIRSGNNGYDGVRGYTARKGWDPASGWGTPAGRLSGALISAGKR
jgi:subtilase family serine protease